MTNRLIIFFLLSSVLTYGQKAFTLTDSIIMPGTYLRTYSIQYEMGNCKLLPQAHLFLDSLVDFLTRNKNVRLEINRHDVKPKPEASRHLASCRATSISDYLVNKGINQKRLFAKGWNGLKPIISETEIKKAKTVEQKEHLSSLNRRVEFVILPDDLGK